MNIEKSNAITSFQLAMHDMETQRTAYQDAKNEKDSANKTWNVLVDAVITATEQRELEGKIKTRAIEEANSLWSKYDDAEKRWLKAAQVALALGVTKKDLVEAMGGKL